MWYCLMTEAHLWTTSTASYYWQWNGREPNPQHNSCHKSDAMPRHQVRGEFNLSMRCLWWQSVAYLRGIRRWPPRVAHPIFLTKNLQAQCMDVWCKAFCCRHHNLKRVPECIRTCHFHLHFCSAEDNTFSSCDIIIHT